MDRLETINRVKKNPESPSEYLVTLGRTSFDPRGSDLSNNQFRLSLSLQDTVLRFPVTPYRKNYFV
jgi:hypothetical protein